MYDTKLKKETITLILSGEEKKLISNIITGLTGITDIAKVVITPEQTEITYYSRPVEETKIERDIARFKEFVASYEKGE